MAKRFMVLAINNKRNERSIIDHFARKESAQRLKKQLDAEIDSGVYGDDEESTIIVIEEIEITDTEV